MVAELMNHETDMVMTSLKINSGREKVIDFSVPYLETGITILGTSFRLRIVFGFIEIIVISQMHFNFKLTLP